MKLHSKVRRFIETETIVATIKNVQGYEFVKKLKPGGFRLRFRVAIHNPGRNPECNPGRNLVVTIVSGLQIEIATLLATLLATWS